MKIMKLLIMQSPPDFITSLCDPDLLLIVILSIHVFFYAHITPQSYILVFTFCIEKFVS
jgi:hypothetical protein